MLPCHNWSVPYSRYFFVRLSCDSEPYSTDRLWSVARVSCFPILQCDKSTDRHDPRDAKEQFHTQRFNWKEILTKLQHVVRLLKILNIRHGQNFLSEKRCDVEETWKACEGKKSKIYKQIMKICIKNNRYVPRIIIIIRDITQPLIACPIDFRLVSPVVSDFFTKDEVTSIDLCSSAHYDKRRYRNHCIRLDDWYR